MKQSFSNVFDLVNSPNRPPRQLEGLIHQSLLEIAHTIDSKFDNLSAMHERLEAKLEKVRKKSDTAAAAAAQANLSTDEATVDVFSQCIAAVRAEVRRRKEV